MKNLLYILVIAIVIAILGILTLNYHLTVGPAILLFTMVPLLGLFLAGRSIKSAIPDLVFGAIDTGLLTIPALWGGMMFGVVGAIAGGVIGDSLTDAIAGFFEGGIAQWLRNRGIETSREPITTSLGKMAGCLFGSGFILSIALIFGINPQFL